MGIQKAGIIGPFRNKVGPSVGRRHLGQDLVTSLPHKSSKPPTAAQLQAQYLFGLLSSYLNKIDQLVNVGFKAFIKNNSPVNAAFKYNYKSAFVLEEGIYQLNYPKILYSRGHIVVPEGAQVASAGGKVTFSWLPQSQSAYCQYTDLASFLVYHPRQNKTVVLQAAVSRYIKHFEMEMPVEFLGDTVHCYMNFDAANGKLQGNSMYVGEVIVLL